MVEFHSPSLQDNTTHKVFTCSIHVEDLSFGDALERLLVLSTSISLHETNPTGNNVSESFKKPFRFSVELCANFLFRLF